MQNSKPVIFLLLEGHQFEKCMVFFAYSSRTILVTIFRVYNSMLKYQLPNFRSTDFVTKGLR